MTAVNLCPFDFGLEKIKRKRTTAAGGSKHDRLGAPRNSREAPRCSGSTRFEARGLGGLRERVKERERDAEREGERERERAGSQSEAWGGRERKRELESERERERGSA